VIIARGATRCKPRNKIGTHQVVRPDIFFCGAGFQPAMADEPSAPHFFIVASALPMDAAMA
jgi:hypothetical protein